MGDMRLIWKITVEFANAEKCEFMVKAETENEAIAIAARLMSPGKVKEIAAEVVS